MRREAKRATRENPRSERNNSRSDSKIYNFNSTENDTTRLRKKKVELIPKSIGQEILLDYLDDPANYIVASIGPAGSGKTWMTTAWAIREFNAGNFDKIVITRPAVAVDEEHGFLPGSLVEKMEPWMMPILDVFADFGYTKRDISSMIDNNKLEIAPLAYMRGRAQPLDSIIYTPTGKTTMGDIKIGDYVLGSDGEPTLVTGVFPQGKKKIYEVIFNDGSRTRVSGEHLWLTQTRSEKKHKKGFTVKTTEEILNSKLKVGNQSSNHEIPTLSSPANFDNKVELKIDPYILGCLLGDGHIGNSNISYSTADSEIVTYFEDNLVDGFRLKQTSKYNYNLAREKNTFVKSPSIYLQNLKELNLCGSYSHNKFIPTEYLYSNKENRLSLLQGLFDTDGGSYIQNNRSPRIQYYSTSKQLATDVQFLVQSLGGVAKIRKRIFENEVRKDDRKIYHKHDCYVLEITLPSNIIPFKLSRKKDRMIDNSKRVYRFISKINEIGYEDCQCISINSDDKLYLTDEFILTHNTLAKSVIIADETQNTKISQMKMLLTRIGHNSKMIITGDIEQNDTGFDNNGLRDFLNRLEKTNISGFALSVFKNRDIVRHPIIEDILKLYT